MTRFYLIRHCEAEGNIYRRCQGQYDSLITQKGERQLAELSRRFRDIELDAIYSSDLYRARRTAEALTRYHTLPIHTDPRLREWSVGAWEDVPFGNLEYDEPGMMEVFNHDPARWSAPGGEPYTSLQDRTEAFLLEAAARHPNQTVACVSHGMAIRSLLARILGLPSERSDEAGHSDNTAVSLLEAGENGIRVVFQNDASHLSRENSTLARQTWWKDGKEPDMNSIRFASLNPRLESETYIRFYSMAWQAAHGNLDGFIPELYLEAAERHVQAGSEALVTIVRPDGSVVGMLELDLVRGAEAGAGWICLCCVEPGSRRSLLGIQMIGHAVSVFRRMGRKRIQLNVFEENRAARAFYEAVGFQQVNTAQGVGGRLLVLEKPI